MLSVEHWRRENRSQIKKLLTYTFSRVAVVQVLWTVKLLLKLTVPLSWVAFPSTVNVLKWTFAITLKKLTFMLWVSFVVSLTVSTLFYLCQVLVTDHVTKSIVRKYKITGVPTHYLKLWILSHHSSGWVGGYLFWFQCFFSRFEIQALLNVFFFRHHYNTT